MQAIFQQMLLLALFLLIGYFLRKRLLLPKNSAIVLSQLENRLLMPALIIQTFMTRCTVDNLKAKGNLALYSAVLIAIFVALGFCFAPLFSKEKSVQMCYRYSFVIPNFSFMGNAVVLGVFGEDVLFDYMIFSIPINLFVYSIGIRWLIPNEQTKEKGKKVSIINPIFVALLIGIFLGLTQMPVPIFLKEAMEATAACMSPIAMILTGFVIGSYPFISLLRKSPVYIMTFLRLIVLPIGVILLLRTMQAPVEAIRCAVCAFAMPMGLNTIIIPAAYGGDTQTGASMALISHGFSILTIPILMSSF